MTTKPNPLAVMDHLIDVAEKRVSLFAQGYAEGREARAALAEIIEQRDAFCLAAAKANKEADELRAAVAELVEADRALDAAQDELVAAKREKGNYRVNSLGHNHAAVVAVRQAKSRRMAALARFEESK